MKTFRTREVVLLECRHVSLSLCSRAVSPDVVCEAIVEVMRRNNWAKCASASLRCMLSHLRIVNIGKQHCVLSGPLLCK